MKEQPECKVYADGTKCWFLNGEYHREDGPAIENTDGSKAWYLNGKRHREDGPAAEWTTGTKDWWLHGKRHREDGPAVEYLDGSKKWFLHNKQVHPEQIVDYHLMRGTFCYYDPETQTFHFDETK